MMDNLPASTTTISMEREMTRDSENNEEAKDSSIEIKVLEEEEDEVSMSETVQKPEILKVHSSMIFQLRPGETPQFPANAHVSSESRVEEEEIITREQITCKIERVSDDENNDPIARLKAQAAENVKNNKTISPVEIKSISELTRLTDKLFKFALDQKNEDGYNSIKCLVRRLRRSRCENPLEKLTVALRTQSADSECITIPKSQDGRIQVAKKKCYPHVLYVQLFRYSDVTHSTPLLSLCKYGRGSSDKVCVNPFHYEKAHTSNIDTSRLTPTQVRCFSQISIIKMEPKDEPIINQPVTISPITPAQERINRRIRRIPQDQFVLLTKPSLDAHIWHRPTIWADIQLFEGETKVGTEVSAVMSEPRVSVLPPKSPYRRGLHRNPLKSYDFFRLNQSIQDNLSEGIQFHWTESGNLSVKNLTNLRIRIDSSSTKMQRQMDLYDPTLLDPNKEKEIFNFEMFQTLLIKARQFGKSKLFSLREHCHARIFFETDSTNRVINMPHLSESLWIMVILHWPLSLLDVYLTVQHY